MSFRPKLSGVIAASLCFALFAACSDGGDSNRNPSPGGGDTQTPVDKDKDKDKDKDPDPQPTVCPAVVDCSIAACAGRACGTSGVCENLKCEEQSQVGDACTGATEANPSGTCSADMECAPAEYAVFSRLVDGAEDNATCTKECETNADCGSTNGVANTCQKLSGFSFCARGCRPGGTDCPADFECLSFGSTNVCVHSCAQNDECIYGTTCLDVGGFKACNPEQCKQDGTCPGANRVCDTSFKGSQVPVGFCVDACTENSCGPGAFCNADSICEGEGETYYQDCGENMPCESADAICIFVKQGGPGICMQNCSTTGWCGGEPRGATCGVTLENNGRACGLPCTKQADCPANTQCHRAGFCLAKDA